MKSNEWTPAMIRSLRGKRTLAEFGALLGVAKNTVWRWETGYSHPEMICAERLSAVARKQHFLKDWKLVNSMKVIGNLESVQMEIKRLFLDSITLSSREL